MTIHNPDDQTRTIEIPERTAESISRRLSETEFDSVDDYAAFALDRLLGELGRTETESGETNPNRENVAEEAVEDRLESLGYL